MRRGLRTATWIIVATSGVACSWDRLPGSRHSEQRNVDLTAGIVAGAWVGHVSGATYTFAPDGTFDAVGVPPATFDVKSFRIAGPLGPLHCHGSWRIAEDRHLLVLDVTSVRDEHDQQPYPQPPAVTFDAKQWVSDPPDNPPKPITLGHGEDWMTEK